MARLQQLLADEPDQAAWAFRARLLLKAEQEPLADADTSDEDDLDGDMSEDRPESGEGSDTGSRLKRKSERVGQGKGYKVRRGTNGRGAGWRGRTVSPGHRRHGTGNGDGTASVDGGFTAAATRQ